jgi:membrane protease YdiL (CAAX protease family)
MKNHKYTYFALFISYFSIVLIGWLIKSIHGGPLNDAWTVVREVFTFAMVGLVLWIIINKEQLSLESIGISNKSWKETTLWSFIILVFCVIAAFACLAIIQEVGLEFGKMEPKITLSLWTTTLVMLRAGIAEEVFFRGYIYERLHTLLRSKWIAVALSLIPFALLHYQQGIAGIFLSFVLGGVLTIMYMWKRNLKANIIAHFLIDFIPNVLIPLLAD